MNNSKTLAVVALFPFLVACTESDGSPAKGVMQGGALSKAEIGTAVGVIGGGVLGSTIGSGAGQVAATIAGGLLGGVLGASVGSSMDASDRAAYNRASQQALETGTTRKWRNPETKHHGSVTPHKRYKNDDGQYCREYTQTIYIDGKSHSARGTACREPDGTWQIVE